MKLEEYKLIFVAVGLIGVLLLATPALGAVIRFPAGEQFSELYVLGPEHLVQNYPHNVIVGQNYSVYLGVGNHLGSSAYYVLYVKFQNESDPLPNATTGAPSPVSPLCEYRFFVPDGTTWSGPLTFSVSDATVLANQSVVESVMINGLHFKVNKPAAWNSNSAVFGYRLVSELWQFNSSSNSIQYDNRFVYLQLNLTKINP